MLKEIYRIRLLCVSLLLFVPFFAFADAIIVGGGLRNFLIISQPTITKDSVNTVATSTSHPVVEAFFYEDYIALSMFLAFPAYMSSSTPSTSLAGKGDHYDFERNTFTGNTAFGITLGPSYTFSPGGIMEFAVNGGLTFLTYWHQFFFINDLAYSANNSDTYKPFNTVNYALGFSLSSEAILYISHRTGIALAGTLGYNWVLNNLVYSNKNLGEVTTVSLQDKQIGTASFSVGLAFKR